MITGNLTDRILFDPIRQNCNELYIVSGYAAPTMLSWYLKNLYGTVQCPVKIELIIRMTPYDGISVTVHNGFIQILHSELPDEVRSIQCSYVFDEPSVHANLFIWAKDGHPEYAFTGSANFVQNSFIGNRRQEIMMECSPDDAYNFYQALTDRTIYADHAEIEEYVVIKHEHPILDKENTPINAADELEQRGYETIRLKLITRNGEPGKHSGLNWGQREHRNPNEAYIPLPRKIAKSGFFPLDNKHFTVLTDDRHQLILRVEQQGDKAITTPARNSDLGEYFRNRMNLPNGTFINRSHLDSYGRIDVTFVKLDDETYFMDFSV